MIEVNIETKQGVCSLRRADLDILKISRHYEAMAATTMSAPSGLSASASTLHPAEHIGSDVEVRLKKEASSADYHTHMSLPLMCLCECCPLTYKISFT